MKRFLTKYGIIALALATAVALSMAVLTVVSDRTDIFTNAANAATAPFRAGAAAVASWIDSNKRYRDEFDALKEENARLKEQLAEVEEELRQAQRDSEENRTLRRLLELREQQRDLSWEAARVTERDVSNWSYAVKLNIGTDYGVEIGDCVITASGYLAGVITDAGSNCSTCTTLIDTDFAIGARLFRTGDVAVAQGDFGLMSDNRLRLSYLDADARPQIGDLVVTSGVGGYYPADLTIGYITEVRTEDDGLAQYAVVQPAVQLEELDRVFVITDFTIVE